MNDAGKIRNVAFVGHRGTGKTSLLEAILYRSGVVNRLGSVQDGSTVSDYDEDEKKRQLSLSATLAHVQREGILYNLIDTPGDSSFLADAIAALRVVETALVVVNTVNGVEVQTERLWERAAERGLARIILCNMLDRERADFTAAVEILRKTFGQQVVAVQLPLGTEHSFAGVVDLL
ncbi:MAG: GTP-binding protein, partial [Actinobacteria bacterium]|nr:GTP-binding protein [Actinomycetota bacterium]